MDEQAREEFFRVKKVVEKKKAKLEKERLQAEREALLNAGVRYTAQLRPYPSSRTDDKLELPPSALQELERQGALESGTLLTFAVSCPGGGPAAVGSAAPALSATHAGVAEFTAEEGAVGVPPRVALCLTKGSGLDSLAAVGQVEVRYLRLPRSAKSLAKLQPRGEGFHIGGASAVRMDLQHVLQETLRGHTALTEGDWLPIRHNGVTYELVVRALEPEPQLALLDTDLTVEVLPSEQTEAELRAEDERKAREEALAREAEERERERLARAAQKAAELGPEPAAGPEVVQLLLRLPDGTRLQRRFRRGEPLGRVLDWVESEPTSRVRPGEFRLVQKWPGHCRELGPSEAEDSLGALGFARQEALFLQHLGSEPAPEAADAVGAAALEEQGGATASGAALPAAASPATGGAWSEAEERAHEALDRRLDGAETPTGAARSEPALSEVRGQELVGVFERLRALGMRPPEAAIAAKKYAPQLKELGEMGFEDWIAAAELLEKYGGRLLRVANLLSERAAEGGAEASEAARVVAAAPPPPAATALAPARAAGAAAGVGTAPMEVDQAPSSPASVEEEAAQPVPADVGEKLRELAAMGFVDEDRNRSLLRKYAGRLERVIEALVSA
mmetsp:Transcript_71512/g.221133  ORF Transcript_71512/g.221133 Transcript_71512/m.221133 type:complete len:620 (+) Transcript_71512:1-1860(+)